jgi:membrane protein
VRAERKGYGDAARPEISCASGTRIDGGSCRGYDMNVRKAFRMVKSALLDFFDDNAMTLGAALAFYGALAIAPLLLILISVTALLGPDIQKQMIGQVEQAVGPQAGNAIEGIVQAGSAHKSAGLVSALVGFVVLLFSASGAFVQMQYSLNTIWEVQPGPGGSSVWRWLSKRVLSLVMILGIGLLLLISMGVSTAINAVFAGTPGYAWQAADFVGSLLIYVLLFALIYKILPDAKTSWKSIWVGAIITAILFAVGKFLLGFYLGRSGVGSPYGAAGSLVVLLLWIYYSSLIFFLGAEFTQAYTRFYGQKMEPTAGARKTPETKEREKELQEATSDRGR